MGRQGKNKVRLQLINLRWVEEKYFPLPTSLLSRWMTGDSTSLWDLFRVTASLRWRAKIQTKARQSPKPSWGLTYWASAP
jgi:hypothetical protein